MIRKTLPETLESHWFIAHAFGQGKGCSSVEEQKVTGSIPSVCSLGWESRLHETHSVYGDNTKLNGSIVWSAMRQLPTAGPKFPHYFFSFQLNWWRQGRGERKANTAAGSICGKDWNKIRGLPKDRKIAASNQTKSRTWRKDTDSFKKIFKGQQWGY